MQSGSLGILGFDSFHFAVENLERSRLFYTNRFDFDEVARAGHKLVEKSGQVSAVFGAGDVRVCVSTPLHEDCKAARYLRRHPAGIMSLSFRVEDLDRAYKLLEQRGAAILAEPIDDRTSSGGRYRAFEIATPLGDVAFRYVERTDYRDFAPGFEQLVEKPKPNRFGIEKVDHVTSNALTMQPLILFYRDVLGMEEFWNIRFHTSDFAREAQEKRGEAELPGPRGAAPPGTGLRSIVMWDPQGDIKFASNEPLRPYFRESQIARFCYDNAGPGIQHLAFRLPDIVTAVRELGTRGVPFLPTHKNYYRLLPERLAKLGIKNVKHDLRALEELEILIDGENDKYMLQIFLREAASLYGDERAGPFFYELIERCGDQGFGYGNFRALFEAIEREQDTHSHSHAPPG
jgi:4-hydroxyphenylpyruvate dioxygenase